MLPGGPDGMEVCQALRRERQDCLVLMLTAKDDLKDKVDGLQAGADDYLTKPFAFDELLARLRALLRRGQQRSRERSLGKRPALRVGDLLLDPGTRTAHRAPRAARRGEREIVLTVRKYALLAYLMENAGKVLSRSRILSRVWSYSFDPETKVVEVYIRQLRQKIDEGEAKPLIKTVRGFGYTITEA